MNGSRLGSNSYRFKCLEGDFCSVFITGLILYWYLRTYKTADKYFWLSILASILLYHFILKSAIRETQQVERASSVGSSKCHTSPHDHGKLLWVFVIAESLCLFRASSLLICVQIHKWPQCTKWSPISSNLGRAFPSLVFSSFILLLNPQLSQVLKIWLFTLSVFL